MQNGEFNDSLLVAVYDAECTWGPDDDFFRAIANETPGSIVLDFGCGTGRITTVLARDGHSVTAIDPAVASLDAAKHKAGSTAVNWLCGGVEQLSTLAADTFDLALMTAHVAQLIVSDHDWQELLNAIHRVLRADGRLVFDSRNPVARRWEQWNPNDSQRTVLLTNGRRASVYTEVTRVHERTVDFTHHYAFDYAFDAAPGQRPLIKTSSSRLVFRTRSELESSLHTSGFDVETIHGGWDRGPTESANGIHPDGEHIVIARKRT